MTSLSSRQIAIVGGARHRIIGRNERYSGSERALVQLVIREKEGNAERACHRRERGSVDETPDQRSLDDDPDQIYYILEARLKCYEGLGMTDEAAQTRAKLDALPKEPPE